MTDNKRAILTGAARVIARQGVRGLRVADLAAEAGVSTGLVYYHFKDRPGILRHALAFIGDRADRYTATAQGPTAAHPPDRRTLLEQTLLLEFQDVPEVRENSTAWGELRAHSVFDPELREELAAAGAAWVAEVAGHLAALCPDAPAGAVTAAAERLTALLEGLSARWLSGLLPLEHARGLLREAIRVEIGRLGSLGERID
ncbi:transcriptional regulator BetI [Streptomyces lavendulae subsp. lavendulae]|uniref:Transcriptional regulator BetI n=1 Tax=Streptomyces lavendulae subsp. lavendulae TaxID=58340 RepID=A0A2K8PMY7_STRLA|nr:TetR/AcrR family transcriptional regulator [Streptomyces lavendulae]ATZ28122.1 transcriptional regulator BetI [Streptomyces lavendulae subsp. lavendulae]QUQ57950.1 HTH-type transcriptional regulator BetI [Streptomyces lavendulae subsp. lavendulae]